MKHRTNVLAIVAATIAMVTAITAIGVNDRLLTYEIAVADYQAPRINTAELSNPRVAGVTEERAVVTIDRGTGTTLQASVVLDADPTAYEALLDAADQLGLPLRTKQYSFGVLVEAIGDQENGDDDKNWIYYVNGGSALVSADQQPLTAGDTVEFKFETSPF